MIDEDKKDFLDNCWLRREMTRRYILIRSKTRLISQNLFSLSVIVDRPKWKENMHTQKQAGTWLQDIFVEFYIW